MLNSLENVNTHLASSAGDEKLLGGRRSAQEHKDRNLQQKNFKPTWKERYNPIAEQDEEIAHFKVQIFSKNHNLLKIDLK